MHTHTHTHTTALCELRVYYLMWAPGRYMWFSCFRNDYNIVKGVSRLWFMIRLRILRRSRFMFNLIPAVLCVPILLAEQYNTYMNNILLNRLDFVEHFSTEK